MSQSYKKLHVNILVESVKLVNFFKHANDITEFHIITRKSFRLQNKNYTRIVSTYHNNFEKKKKMASRCNFVEMRKGQMMIHTAYGIQYNQTNKSYP